MFVLKNLIKPFLLPPGCFILLVICYGAWCLIRRHFFRGFAFLTIGIIAWGLSISPVSDMLLRPLESGIVIPKNPSGDVIIILGAGTNIEKPGPLGKGTPSLIMLPRLMAGARLHKNLGIPILISGQGDSRDVNATKTIMSLYMKALGVSAGKIIIENKSRNTYENAVFSVKICRDKRFEKPILVTDAYHMKRAVLCFQDEDLNTLPFPSGFETWNGKRYTWVSFLPGDFRSASIALREYLGLLYYQIIFPNIS